MAPKRPTVFEDPPAPETSSDDEVEESSEEEEEEEDTSSSITPETTATSSKRSKKNSDDNGAVSSLSSEASDEESKVFIKILASDRNPLPESLVKRAIKLIPEDKKAEIVAKWRKTQLRQIELFSRRTQLLSEYANLIHQAFISDD